MMAAYSAAQAAAFAPQMHMQNSCGFHQQPPPWPQQMMNLPQQAMAPMPPMGSTAAMLAASGIQTDDEQPTDGKLDRPCAACRLSRVRCNRVMPCSRCWRLGLECKQPRKVQRGRPSHKARLARAQAQAQQAQAEAQQTLAQVHALSNGQQQFPPGHPMAGMMPPGMPGQNPWPMMPGMQGMQGRTEQSV